MIAGVPIPQWVPATAMYCSPCGAGYRVTREPGYQIDAGYGGDRFIALTVDEMEAVCKAVLKDIRTRRKGKVESSD